MAKNKVDYIPANFRLSPRAVTKLNELTELSCRATSRSMIPALFWAEEYDEIKRQTVVLGLSIGWYYRDEIPATLLQEVDGVPVIFPVSQKDASHFDAKTVDFQGDRFFLVS